MVPTEKQPGVIGLALNSLLYIGNSFADLTEQASKTCSAFLASQRSLHNAPIFRLLLKVAVKRDASM